MIAVSLDEYEVANLRAMLQAITRIEGPLISLASGDWTWQILDKLPEVSVRPNKTAEETLALFTGMPQ